MCNKHTVFYFFLNHFNNSIIGRYITCIAIALISLLPWNYLFLEMLPRGCIGFQDENVVLKKVLILTSKCQKFSNFTEIFAGCKSWPVMRMLLCKDPLLTPDTAPGKRPTSIQYSAPSNNLYWPSATFLSRTSTLILCNCSQLLPGTITHVVWINQWSDMDNSTMNIVLSAKCSIYLHS